MIKNTETKKTHHKLREEMKKNKVAYIEPAFAKFKEL